MHDGRGPVLVILVAVTTIAAAPAAEDSSKVRGAVAVGDELLATDVVVGRVTEVYRTGSRRDGDWMLVDYVATLRIEGVERGTTAVGQEIWPAWREKRWIGDLQAPRPDIGAELRLAPCERVRLFLLPGDEYYGIAARQVLSAGASRSLPAGDGASTRCDD